MKHYNYPIMYAEYRIVNSLIPMSYSPPLVIEVLAPSHERRRSCICMLGVSILPLFSYYDFSIGF